MSGYFARLSAQLQAPAALAQGAVAPAPLERHVQVDAAAPVHALGAGVAAAPGKTPLATAAPKPSPAARSRTAKQHVDRTPSAVRQHAPLLPVMRDNTSGTLQPREPAITASRQMTFASEPVGLPAINRTTPWQGPDAGEPINAAAHEAQATDVQRPGLPRDGTQPLAQIRTDDDSWSASPEAREPSPSAFVRPSARADVRDHARMSSPQAATPSTPSVPKEPPERHTVRIGTITLEVHPPSVTAPSAPQPVAAPSTPAPAQFSLRRHHLRWI